MNSKSSSVFVFLFFACVCFSCTCAILPTAVITNKLPSSSSSQLWVECSGQKTDERNQTIPFNGEHIWTFEDLRGPIQGSCDFRWNGKGQFFLVVGYGVDCLGDTSPCHWTVKQDGFYLSRSPCFAEKKHDWDIAGDV
ncbi:hypothetical protein M9H77_04850 [Catharanthus roseus]|uniref:Uncharacterized protein n=1 Tax=Catharanthus roseus TaxID=4058 RepID=A0ACC0CFL3_CATRO|nr:hypothetical protein M9H77_04850 [Catharanthus roseus]